MSDRDRLSELPTHQVVNQPEPLSDYDAWASDRPLRDAVARAAPDWVAAYAADLGAETGRGHWFEQGERANRYPPELRAFDAQGRRLDEVHYHPAYHDLMRLACEAGAHAVAWTAERGGHPAHTAALYLLTQPEQGFCCPLVMTHASVPALRREPAVAEAWVPRILASAYDPRNVPAADKPAVTVGMAMTEKQGGSDVRRNTTAARALDGDAYELTGHKWFCSAPMSDAFLTLAQTGDGLTCFLVPRWRPDGTRNRIFIQRLKDKCGNRSNASSEIDYHGAWAQRVGESGRGVATIIGMVQQTRLDAATAPVGMLRQALVRALHHCRGRAAFGGPLIERPLMRRVLADLALEVEAGLALVMRLSTAHDHSDDDEQARLLARLGTAVAKYWTNKRAPQALYEAMECLGGNGYVEESILARLYREAPVNSIWEGSGNVICLDVLRAMQREPETVPAFLREIGPARGLDARFDRHVARLEGWLRADGDPESRARLIVEGLALAWQASLLLQHGDPAVAEGFCAARLGGGTSYGAIDEPIDEDTILARVWPGVFSATDGHR